MFLRQKLKIFIFTQKLSQLSHDCLETKNFSRKLQCVSRLPNRQKTRVFNFYVADVTFFFLNLFTSLALPLLNPFQPKSHFLSKTHIFQVNLCSTTSKYVFLTLFESFLLRLCRFQPRVLKIWGFFEKGLGFLSL